MLSVADNYVPNMQGVQISAGYLLGQELLYLLGVGAGETIGDRHLPAVGLDDDVGKEIIIPCSFPDKKRLPTDYATQ